jgi:hypothetical protein
MFVHAKASATPLASIEAASRCVISFNKNKTGGSIPLFFQKKERRS